MRKITFYFDFLSPYAYLARYKLMEIAAKHNCEIVYRPIDLKRAKVESGNDGPSTLMIANKLAFANKDFERWAKIYGVPFRSIGGPVGGRDLNVGALYAIKKNCAEEYLDRVYLHCWGMGGKADDAEFLSGLMSKMGWDEADFNAFVASDEAEAEYERTFQLAAADHVFGVPAFVVDDELWWGNDRLFMVDEYLSAHH
jgi:2-hydroxychromene-2-carboxylate isomerase